MENAPKKRGRPRKNKEPIIEEPEIAAVEETVFLPQAEDTEEVHSLPPIIEEAPVAEPVQEPVRYTEIVYKAPAVIKDDSKDKKNIIGKLKKYQENFELLRKFKIDETKTVEELQSQLDEFRITISSKNTVALMKSSYIMGVKGIEMVGSKIGSKLYGMADLLSKSKEIDQLMLELQAEMSFGHVPPMQRLAFITLASAVAVDGANRKAELLNSFASSEIKADIKDKYNTI